ncbi:MAG: hypothetical protein M1838_003582 [Thelocarpon superellum]|nr:MAG: hypothetical protein M1838_003582 [Thelocarpon superellum]
MFGAICAGRPVQTNLQKLSDAQYVFTLPSVPAFNHLVVFLLPGTVLPPGTAAAVYIQLPPSIVGGAASTPAEFKLLGAIGNEKQSAIFKIGYGHGGKSHAHAAPDDVMAEDGGSTTAQHAIDSSDAAPAPITLGISLEPAAQIAGQLASAVSSASSASVAAGQPRTTSTSLVKRPPSTKVLAQRIIKDAFNFLASFSVSRADTAYGAGYKGNVGTEGAGRRGELGGTGDLIPLRIFQDWWTKFEKRLDVDPTFLDRDLDG